MSNMKRSVIGGFCAAVCLLAQGCNQNGTAGTGTPATNGHSTVTHSSSHSVTVSSAAAVNSAAAANSAAAFNSAPQNQSATASEHHQPASPQTNTAVNARDRNENAKLPTSQGENKGDIQITADIRKEVIAANMSVDANNVKIITQNGKVTLRGPVDNLTEKKKISNIAATIVGASNVDNELETVTK